MTLPAMPKRAGQFALIPCMARLGWRRLFHLWKSLDVERGHREGKASTAVLIRAIQPIEGVEVMMERRQGRDTFGPGKLTQALGITKSQNYADLTESASSLRIRSGDFSPDKSVTIGLRVGLNKTVEPWLSMQWQFLVKGWKIEF